MRLTTLLMGLALLLHQPVASAETETKLTEIVKTAAASLYPQVKFTRVDDRSTKVQVFGAAAETFGPIGYEADHGRTLGLDKYGLVNKTFMVPTAVAEALQIRGPLRVTTSANTFVEGARSVRLVAGEGDQQIVVQHDGSQIASTSKGKKRSLWIHQGAGERVQLAATYVDPGTGKWKTDPPKKGYVVDPKAPLGDRLGWDLFVTGARAVVVPPNQPFVLKGIFERKPAAKRSSSPVASKQESPFDTAAQAHSRQTSTPKGLLRKGLERLQLDDRTTQRARAVAEETLELARGVFGEGFAHHWEVSETAKGWRRGEHFLPYLRKVGREVVEFRPYDRSIWVFSPHQRSKGDERLARHKPGWNGEPGATSRWFTVPDLKGIQSAFTQGWTERGTFFDLRGKGGSQTLHLSRRGVHDRDITRRVSLPSR
jgi:hypothetical protein